MHVYSQDGYSFYKCMTGTSGIFYRTFPDDDTRVSMKVKQSQKYFCIEFRVTSMVIWNLVAENRFLMGAEFPMK